jgi:putative membrane protein
MMKTALLGASVLALGLAACSPKNPDATATVTTPAPMAGSITSAAMPAAADDKTKNFVEKAALSDMFEIESAKIALTRSKVKPVKDFAQMMIDDHTATTVELGKLAGTAGVMPPTALDEDHLKKLDDLKTAKVQDFDDKYIDQQTAAHSAALDLMKDYADNGKDVGIQSFAAKVALKVDEHLQKVKALDKSPADDVTKAPAKGKS